MSIGRRLFYMYSLDFVVSITVIAALVVMLVNQSLSTRVKVMSVADAAGVLGEFRVPMSVFYAINGEWPKDREALRPYLTGKSAGATNDGALIDKGAITMQVRRVPDANMLTLHPAVSAGDPLGTVIWVAGSKSTSDGWVLIGEDHTSLADSAILRTLK